MSSMRNAAQRRNHKERAQPKDREKWGVLEKHKDYSLRAKDYNVKKARLKILRQKATERNPDEFYFGMYSSKTHDKGQKLADRGNVVLSHDAAKLLKTQDAGYLKTMAQQTRRARERLEKGIVMREGRGVEVRGSVSREEREHVIYVESKEEQKAFVPERKSMDPKSKSKASQTEAGAMVGDGQTGHLEETDDEEAGDITAPAQKTRRALEAEATALKQARILRKQRKRDQDAQTSRLRALKSREKDLLAAERELELQRAKMSNSIGGVNKAGVKFKIRERKR